MKLPQYEQWSADSVALRYQAELDAIRQEC